MLCLWLINIYTSIYIPWYTSLSHDLWLINVHRLMLCVAPNKPGCSTDDRPVDWPDFRRHLLETPLGRPWGDAVWRAKVGEDFPPTHGMLIWMYRYLSTFNHRFHGWEWDYDWIIVIYVIWWTNHNFLAIVSWDLWINLELRGPWKSIPWLESGYLYYSRRIWQSGMWSHDQLVGLREKLLYRKVPYFNGKSVVSC